MKQVFFKRDNLFSSLKEELLHPPPLRKESSAAVNDYKKSRRAGCNQYDQIGRFYKVLGNKFSL